MIASPRAIKSSTLNKLSPAKLCIVKIEVSSAEV
jgi:hypothetical protein